MRALARAALRTAAREAAWSVRGLSEAEFAVLVGELADVPCMDLSLQVELPKLLSPGLERLCEAVAEDDELTGEAVLDEVLDEINTPLERARVARAVIAARDGGRLEDRLAATALVDLSSGSGQLLCAGLIEAVAVRVGRRWLFLRDRRAAAVAPLDDRPPGGRIATRDRPSATPLAAKPPANPARSTKSRRVSRAFVEGERRAWGTR
jgi:hypothetical protein